MNIKYSLQIKTNTQHSVYPLFTLGKQKSTIIKPRSNSVGMKLDSTSISEMPAEKCELREKMDQEILIQGLQGLKIGLSGRVKIGSTKFGYAWKH